MKKLKLVENMSFSEQLERLEGGERLYLTDHKESSYVEKTIGGVVKIYDCHESFERHLPMYIGPINFYIEVEPEWYETISFPTVVFLKDETQGKTGLVVTGVNRKGGLITSNVTFLRPDNCRLANNEEIKQFLQPESESDEKAGNKEASQIINQVSFDRSELISETCGNVDAACELIETIISSLNDNADADLISKLMHDIKQSGMDDYVKTKRQG